MAAKPLRVLVIAALSLLIGAARAQGSGDDADSFEADPPDRAARLAYLAGDVSLQPAGEDEWAPALLNRPLTTGDKLWTENGARVEIQVSQSAVRLDGNTGFSFLDLGDDTIQMRITAGTVIVDVRALDSREQIEIDTPNVALAILRPGSYRVEVNDAGDATTVKIGHGEAEATGTATNTLIRAEQVVTFRGVDELVADWGTLGPADDFDEWSMARERRGERVASTTAKYVSPEVTGYDDLDEYGTWSSEPEYGYVWTPRHVVVGWSPYRYGRWVWISPWGWTWIDDAPWGYAPFHYGRWAHVRNRWCWVPGPRHVRAVYAPALVGWVGSRGAYVSWVPLGPRDVYVPHRRFSRHYWERVNFANARAVERQQIREIFERRRDAQDYRNRHAPDSITAVARNAFTGAQRVGERRVNFNEREMAGHDGNGMGPRLRPGRESRLGGTARATPRISPAIAARQVVVKREPPASSARFARPAEQRPIGQRPSDHRTDLRTQGDARRTLADRVRDTQNNPHRNDRPSRAERDTPNHSPTATPGAQRPARPSDSLTDRVREARERQARDANDPARWQRNDRPDRPARTDRPDAAERTARPERGAQDGALESRYPQYSQQPRRTQDAVREAVARQLEHQRERQTSREPDHNRARVEQPRADYRQAQPRTSPPVEQRREQPRIEHRTERPQPQPRAEPPRERSQPQSRPQPSSRPSAPEPRSAPRGSESHRQRR